MLTTQYGDCFTFVLLGKKTTVFLGATGNQFILNGSSKDLNAEEVYRPLTAPVFGKGVIYDCPNSKLMDQKRVCILCCLYHNEALVQRPTHTTSIDFNQRIFWPLPKDLCVTI